MMAATEVFAVAGVCLLFLILAMLRQAERAVQERTAEARIANELAKRKADLAAYQRLQAVRAEHAARHHGRHHHGQHGHGNASLAGGCE
jgi:hypothetical protein